MAAVRERKTDKEKEEERDEAKERMAAARDRKTDKEKEEELDEARERMEENRENKCKEERDYDKIVHRISMRNHRKNQTGKEHLEGNLKAKKGMSLLNSEGSIMEFSRRETGHRKADEELEWKTFMGKSQKHAEQLGKKKPDIVEKINESNRIEQEKERLRQEKVKDGEWDWHGESGEWFWTGKDPPKDEDS